MRDALKQGLREWKKLPESERAPGAVKIDDLKAVDQEYVLKPPAGGLVLDVAVRLLDKSGDALGFCSTCTRVKLMADTKIESQRDQSLADGIRVESADSRRCKDRPQISGPTRDRPAHHPLSSRRQYARRAAELEEKRGAEK